MPEEPSCHGTRSLALRTKTRAPGSPAHSACRIANLLYKIIASRNQKRLVEGAIILKVKGKSYRAEKATASETIPDKCRAIHIPPRRAGGRLSRNSQLAPTSLPKWPLFPPPPLYLNYAHDHRFESWLSLLMLA
jgi:hypothetical protein